MLSDPRTTYEDRRATCLERADQHRKKEDRLANLRLALFAGALAASTVRVVAEGTIATVAGGLAPILLIGFGVAVAGHVRRRRLRERAEAGASWYGTRLSRMKRTGGTIDDGARFQPADHEYAPHFDLFGPDSMFAALCDARTEVGRATLARWLLEPARAATVTERQVRIREFVPELDLRERRAVLEDIGESRLPGNPLEALVGWAQRPAALHVKRLRPIAWGFTAISLLTAIAVLAFGLSAWWLLRVFVAQAAFAYLIRRRTTAAFDDLEPVSRELRRIAAILDLMPNEVTPADIVHLRTPYRLNLRRDWMGNLMFAPLGAAVLWGTHHALLLEAWRSRHGDSVGRWTRQAGSYEALLDLSAHAYEHPHDAFPDVQAADVSYLNAAGLAHPLIAEDLAIRSDVALAAKMDGAPFVLCVTGANMTGKSTLLRAVGLNTILARMGAPVRAASMSLSELYPVASIRTNDSLADAASGFYAELKAIGRIVAKARTNENVLFLMDEVMGGTDSGDREIGVVGLLAELLDRRSIGLLSTHDRRLAERLESEFAPRLANVHLGWKWTDGELTFLYRLQPGLNPTTNAVELMRSMGLAVHRE